MFDKEFLFAYLIYFFLPDVLLTTKLLPVIRPISESTLKGRYQRIRSSFSRQAPSQDIWAVTPRDTWLHLAGSVAITTVLLLM